MSATMTAVTFDHYGSAANLHLREIPIPTPGPGQVRLKVAAVGLNAFDWHQYTGKPLIMRTHEGWRLRERRVLGADLAGTVDAVGEDVTAFAPGDRVLGEIGRGALAQFALADVEHLALLPHGVPMTAAAAVPMAGLTALQAIRDAGALQQGDSVLVWGASGGVGHLAVRLARILGAGRVDAVCSGHNSALVRRLGADAVADYTRGEVPPGRYDLIVDTVATASLRSLKRLLTDRGQVITLGGVANGAVMGPGRPIFRRVAFSRLWGVRHSMMVAQVRSEDLARLASLLADESLAPVIHRQVPLEDVRSACEELEAGHVPGKLVIVVNDAV